MSKHAERYSLGAILLHWLTVVMIIGLVGIGWQLDEKGWDLATKFQLYQLHKSLGVSVFALTLLRIIWRLTHRAPAPAFDFKPLERFLARSVHFLFYVLLLVIPLSGWVVVSSASFNIETVIFGVIPLPHIWFLEALSPEAKKSFEPIAEGTHQFLVRGLLFLLALHVVGALKHHFSGASIFYRMVPPFRGDVTNNRLNSIILSPVLLVAFSLFSVDQAAATNWSFDQEKSKVTFSLSVAGQNVVGRVETFSGTAKVDLSQLADASVSVTLNLDSLTVGNSDGDAALKTVEWFDVSNHPTGRFEGRGFRKSADNEYEMDGVLTLKEKSLPITLPFTLKIEGDRAVATAKAQIDRTDFDIGNSADTGPIKVGEAVEIAIEIQSGP